MQYFLIGLAMLASPVTNKSHLVKIGVGYHRSFGIPHAASIKAFENEIFMQQVKLGRSEADPFSDDWMFGGAAIRPHPYMGGLLIDLTTGRISVCVSSLLTHNRLVTAAHCWRDGWSRAKRFTVVLGSNWLFYGGTRVKASRVVMHPRWNPKELINDIAMVYLPGSVWFSATIQPIPLPSQDHIWDQFEEELATAVGFGREEHEIYLNKGGTNYSVISPVTVKVISSEKCDDFFGHWARSTNICARGEGDVGICHGDSGGPLLVNRSGQDILVNDFSIYIVGITSFMPYECQLEHPSVFTRVTSFYDFIIRHLKF